MRTWLVHLVVEGTTEHIECNVVGLSLMLDDVGSFFSIVIQVVEEVLHGKRWANRGLPLAITLDAQRLVPGFSVNAVDTTAGGDALNGGLAAALAQGKPLLGALRIANACGALATTRLGAQPSLPMIDEVEAFLAERGGQ